MSKHYFECKLLGDPEVDVREVLPGDNEDVIKDKNKYPFIAYKRAILKIFYDGEWFCLSNAPNYKYDGATIPFRIGKGNMKLLIPALYHEIVCENKSKLNYNRYLSSLMFKDLLLQCKVNKVIAQGMFIIVDLFQRTQRGWK